MYLCVCVFVFVFVYLQRETCSDVFVCLCICICIFVFVYLRRGPAVTSASMAQHFSFPSCGKQYSVSDISLDRNHHYHWHIAQQSQQSHYKQVKSYNPVPVTSP